MNSLKVFLALLLASASLIYSTSYTSAGEDQNVVGRLSDADRRALNEIIQRGDDPQALDRLLGESSPIFDPKLFAPFQTMIEGGKNRSFELLLSRINFQSAFRRNAATWSILLRVALFHGNLEAAETLLYEPGFQIDRSYRENVWWTVYEDADHASWDLEGLKAMISRHPEHAADLAPTYLDVMAASGAEAMLLVDLALHCDAESVKLCKPTTFDASRFLNDGLISSYIGDEEMAVVIGRLCELGAEVSRESYASLERRLGGYPLAREQLRECELARECEAIGKVPEEEADLVE